MLAVSCTPSAAELERAVLVLSNPGHNSVCCEQFQAAQQLCNQAASGGWQAYVCTLGQTSSLQVRFWCLSELVNLVQGASPVVDLSGRSELRMLLPSWKACAIESAELNKLAALYIAILRCDYPSDWPTAFSDLLSCDDFAVRVLTFFLEDCTDDPECAGLIQHFAAADISKICMWAMLGDALSVKKLSILAKMASYLPHKVLIDFPYPPTVERYDMAVAILENAGSNMQLFIRVSLLLEILHCMPWKKWFEEHQHAEREKAAELCCTVGETLWNITADASLETTSRSTAWDELKMLLPTALAFWSSGEFRVANSIEEFFSLVFQTRASDVPHVEVHRLLIALLDASFPYFVWPAWLQCESPDDDEHAVFMEFKSDLKQMLRHMRHYNSEAFDAHLKERLLSHDLQSKTQFLEGALCILCNVAAVGAEVLEMWKPVVEAVILRQQSVPLGLRVALLEIMHRFAAVFSKPVAQQCIDVQIQSIAISGCTSLACMTLQHFVSQRSKDIEAMAATIFSQLLPLVGPATSLSEVNQQALCEIFGNLCSRTTGEDQRASIIAVLRQLLEPLGAAHLTTVVGRVIFNVAAFFFGIGDKIDPDLPEWKGLLCTIQDAALQYPTEKSVAQALNKLGLGAELNPALLLPFFSRIWHIVTQDELHLALATKLLDASPGSAHDFACAALPLSLQVCQPEEMDTNDWLMLLGVLQRCAPHCSQNAMWNQPVVQNFTVSAVMTANDASQVTAAAHTWTAVLLAGGTAPQALAQGFLDRLSQLDTSNLEGRQASGNVCKCVELIHQLQGLSPHELAALGQLQHFCRSTPSSTSPLAPSVP